MYSIESFGCWFTYSYCPCIIIFIIKKAKTRLYNWFGIYYQYTYSCYPFVTIFIIRKAKTSICNQFYTFVSGILIFGTSATALHFDFDKQKGKKQYICYSLQYIYPKSSYCLHIYDFCNRKTKITNNRINKKTFTAGTLATDIFVIATILRVTIFHKRKSKNTYL